MAKHYLRHLAVSALALAAAVIVSCAQPVAAQDKRTASGQYIDCAQVATDVSLMARAMKLGLMSPSLESAAATEWYTRVVVAHTRKALSQSNPQEYIRSLHKQCLLESA